MQIEDRIAKTTAELERRKIPKGCSVSKVGQQLFIHMSKCNNPQDVHWSPKADIVIYDTVVIEPPYTESSLTLRVDAHASNKEKHQRQVELKQITAQVKRFYEKQSRGEK